MATVIFNREIFEKEIGKIDEKMENKIALFGTPVEQVSNKEIHIEIFPNRPDLLSYQGFKRSFLNFLGKEKGMKEYRVRNQEKDYVVNVDSSVKDVRPFTACAIIRGMKLDNEKIKEIIDIQEKLHNTVGRKRKKLAIGIYSLDKIKLPITFKAMKPEEIKFIPLGSEKEMSGNEILKKNDAGKEHAHLLKGMEKYPVFVDSEGKILSMPPIINSREIGKVGTDTRDIFIECSGTDFEALKKCINILSATFADMGGDIFQMEIKMKGKKEMTPDFTPETMKISRDYVNKILGLELTEKQISEMLEKMGYNVKNLLAEIPQWRVDVLHEIDLVEDVAIAYGYENFVPEIPEISTIGKENEIQTAKRKISEILAGLNMLQVSNYHLTNEENQFKNLGLPKKKFVELESSKTDYNILRKDLSHYLMKNFSENIDSEYPQRIFEIGKVFSLGKEDEILENENLSFAISPGNFTEAKQVLEYLFRTLDLEIKISEAEQDSFPKYFVDGRVGEISFDGKVIGYLGEIHPRILRNWKIKMPVALCEIGLEEVFKKIK